MTNDSETTPVTTETRQNGGGGNAFLAVLIGGFLAGGAGYVAAYYTEFGLFQAQDAETPISAISDSLETQSNRLEELERALQMTGEGGPAQAELEDALSTVTDQVTALSERLELMESGEVPEPVDLSPYDEQLSGLQGELTGLQEQSDAQAAQLQNVASAEQLAQLSQRVDQLASTVEDQQQAIQNASQSAQSEANRIATQAALAGLRAALDTGAPYAEDLGAFRSASDAAVPEPLAAPAETGVPTLNQLRESFAEPAREALSASIGATAGDGFFDRFGAFIRAQVGARSLDERQGDSADAILSRAEARLDEGDLQAALDQISSLPEAGQLALAGWTDRARERLAATDAFAELSSSVTSN